MLFSSLVFICAFLPLLLFIYYTAPRSWRNNILLASSLLFYAWGEVTLVWVMIASIIWNHVAALVIDRTRNDLLRKVVFAAGVIVDIAALGYFKYTDFFIENWNSLSGMALPLKHIVLPIGISFYTFQAVSYLTDVFRHDTPAEKNLLNTGLYITFFPQLIAGPIVKFHEISDYIRERSETLDKFAAGLQRFIEGLAKKVLIANVMAETADAVFSSNTAVLLPQEAWLGIFAYSMQIFFDFSGYSDMAIGLGKMFGFEIPENFNFPYTAASVTQFWRKWHISLSTWFKEYLYIPLGGSRAGRFRTLRNLGIVFLVTGFWHGAGWNFIFWGAWHGAFIILERIFKVDKKSIPVLGNIYLLMVVLTGWVFFRAETFSSALLYIRRMFCFSAWNSGGMMVVSGTFAVMALFAVFYSTTLPRMIYNRLNKNGLLVWRSVCCLLLFLVLLRLAGASYNPFIYFRF
ncbi:MAG: MBOAT family protein [Lentisphaeria bacterium]|nr:MBOAT family protein [Lentisphaeria bacterium]